MTRSPFSYLETHRVVHQPGSQVHCSSENAGWTSLFACICSEASYEGILCGRQRSPCRHSTEQTGSFHATNWRRTARANPAAGQRDHHAGWRRFQYSHLVTMRTVRHPSLLRPRRIHPRDSLRDVCIAAAIALPPRVGVMDEMLRTIAHEIRKMLLAPSPVDRIYAETLSRTAANYLVRNHISRRSSGTNEHGHLTPYQCHRAIEYIEECLSDNLTLAGIAKAAGVSAARLNSEFKRSTKLAPHQYVLNARVRRANALLMSTDLSLAQIALECGFSNQQHMTRMVRRITGRTPGAIRRDR